VGVTIGNGEDTINGGAGIDTLEVRKLSGTFTAKASNLSNTLSDGTTFINMEAYSLTSGFGTSTVENWTTGDGNDTMYAFDGNDILSSGKGNDYIDAGVGVDIVNSGDGNDRIVAGNGGKDTIRAGAGTDTVTIERRDAATALTFSITGVTGTINDGTTVSDAEHYSIYAGSGSDTLTAGAALSVKFYGANGNDRLTGGKGSDWLDGGAGNDTLTGGDGNDTIYDEGGANTVDAGTGNDLVDIEIGSGTAANSVLLGTGNDLVKINSVDGLTAGKFTVDGGTGTDTASVNRSMGTANMSFVLSPNAVLTNGDVTLRNIEAVQIWTGSGTDSLTGGALNDLFHGGAGNDTLKGLAGNDRLYGGVGADRLEGGDGNDTLQATHGTRFDTQADRLYGGAGNDSLRINQGDYADAGTGTDRVYVDLANQATGVSFAFSNGTVTVNATTKFAGAESLEFYGTSGNDRVTAGALNDVLKGNSGNDTLRGGAGDDLLEDGAGNDKLYGDAGNDTLIRTNEIGTDSFDGGAGTDTLKFSLSSTMSVKLDLANSANNGGMAKGLTVTGVEVVYGSDRDDDIRGTSANEKFFGGGADDFLFGGAGDDVLEGGAAGDLLQGGTGTDQFVFHSDGFGTGDQIVDFTRGQDKLVVDRSDFGIAASGNPGFIIGANPTASGTGPQFLFETDNGRLWYDRDGTGNNYDAELIVTLANGSTHVSTLAISDFLFV
ncbi:calcium-binding protein, partial [Sinorhizobium fredii]|uniref:calcium-binding protein n=1 Tax=Rhizobium fredii TaxID=380 RepID=UPI00055AA1BB